MHANARQVEFGAQASDVLGLQSTCGAAEDNFGDRVAAWREKLPFVYSSLSGRPLPLFHQRFGLSLCGSYAARLAQSSRMKMTGSS